MNLFRDDAAVELMPSISGQEPSSDKQILKSLDGVIVPIGRSYGEYPVSDLIALNNATAALLFSRCLTAQWHEFSSFWVGGTYPGISRISVPSEETF